MGSKSRFRKLFFLYIVMALTLMPFSAFAATDISGHWAKEQINEWSSKQLITGYSDNTFKPDNSITRAEFFALINKVFGYQEKAAINFSDVSGGAWYYDEIAKAAAAGYAAGYPDGTIKPQAYITRQEASAVVAAAFGLGKEAAISASEFKDSGQIESWANSSVAVMKNKGLISGYPDGTFGPKNNIKRAETVIILNNASGNIINQSGTYSEEAKGNLVVNAGNVILKDMTIAGDLYLAEGIGDGEVTLDGVSVTGKTLVRGGGENSVILRNTTLGDVEVNKPRGSGQPVRIVSEGNTSVAGTVTVNSGIKLEEKNISQGATGFNNVIVSDKLSETAKVMFSGNFKEVILNTNQGTIEISKDAVVSTVTVQAATKVVIANGAKVAAVTVTETAKGAAIQANAEVKVQVKAENVTVNNTAITSGSTANVSSGGTVTTPNSSSSSGSDDSGSDTEVEEPAAIQGANVNITTGSAVFNYEFYGTDLSTITYAAALVDPYNLNLAASTVRLEKRVGETVYHATYNITLDTLNITPAGTVSYVDVDAVNTAFGNPDFVNVWQGSPTHIVLVLKGGLAEDAWELEPITIQLEQSDTDAFGSIMPLPGGGGAPAAFVPGEGGVLPVFSAFSVEPGKIGGLYVDRSQRENDLFGGDRAVVDLYFTEPSAYGAASFTLQYSDDNGATWQNYQNGGVDVVTAVYSQDNFSINPGGDYKYRLLVNGGESDGYISNEVEAPLSAVDTAFSGWHLDEGMALTGVITPYVGCGKAASFTVTSLSDGSQILGYLSYQWYRVNPESFEMTPVPGAISLTYTTTPEDAGYYLICRATGDGVNVGGFVQILCDGAPEIPNQAYVTDVTATGFRLNLYRSISGLTHEDLKLYYYNELFQLVNVPITSITHIENNAVFDVSAELPDGVTSFILENNSLFWRIVSETGHMITPSVEIPMVG